MAAASLALNSLGVAALEGAPEEEMAGADAIAEWVEASPLVIFGPCELGDCTFVTSGDWPCMAAAPTKIPNPALASPNLRRLETIDLNKLRIPLPPGSYSLCSLDGVAGNRCLRSATSAWSSPSFERASISSAVRTSNSAAAAASEFD
jgi:hypothetical protein